MKINWYTKLLVVLVVAAVVAGVLAGCGGTSTVTETKTSTVTTTAAGAAQTVTVTQPGGAGATVTVTAPGATVTAAGTASTTTVTVTGAATPTSTAAVKPITIKYGSAWKDIAATNAARWMGSEIEKRTGGRVKFEYYEAASVVGAKEERPGVISGVVDWAPVHPTYYVTDMPMAQYSWTVPFLPKDEFISVKLFNKLLDEFPQLRNEVEKYPVKHWGEFTNGQYDFNATFPLTSVDDIKGKKLCALGTWEPKWIEAAGGVPVTVALPDRFTALQTGTVAGNIGMIEYFVGYKFYDAGAKYITIAGFGSRTGGYQVMNKDKWASLPADIQQVFNEVVPLAITKSAELAYNGRNARIAQGVVAGVQFNVLSDKERMRWGELIKPAIAQWIDGLEKAGLPGKQFMKRIQEISAELGEPMPLKFVE